jgi:cytochrome c biogenesis protein CcdA
MSISILSIFTMAMAFGLIHALDADHVAAVTGLSATSNKRKAIVSYCVRWAAGHAASLLFIALLIFSFGVSLPDWVGSMAEMLAGAILVLIGALLVRQIVQQRIRFSVHQHEHQEPHAHLHTADHAPRSDHRATLIGVVHGFAGSAPIMVMIPITQLQSGWQAVGYVLVFSAGVVVSMLLFGGVLGSSLQFLSRYGKQAIVAIRSVASVFSIVIGVQLMFHTWASL